MLVTILGGAWFKLHGFLLDQPAIMVSISDLWLENYEVIHAKQAICLHSFMTDPQRQADKLHSFTLHSSAESPLWIFDAFTLNNCWNAYYFNHHAYNNDLSRIPTINKYSVVYSKSLLICYCCRIKIPLAGQLDKSAEFEKLEAYKDLSFQLL